MHEMQSGGRVRRAGWSGMGMWLEMHIPDQHSSLTLPFICMKTVQDDLVPWTCSQTDLLANDWEVAA